MNATIKRIILSIIQFDADIKAGNTDGINKFLEIIPDYESYFSLRVPNKYEEKILYRNFKKEILDLFTALFVEDGIYKVAENLFVKIGDIEIQWGVPYIKNTTLNQKIGKIGMGLDISVHKWDGSTPPNEENFRWEKNPLYNLSDEEYIERLGSQVAGFKAFKETPFKEFVSKYQGLYNRETELDTKEILSLQELALIAAYEGKIIMREEGKINQYFNYYSKRKNRIGIETSRKKTSNKIERIEKIIPHLSKSAQRTAIDEVNTLKSALEKETF